MRQSSQSNQSFVANTISVSGEGKIKAAPDSMVIIVAVNELAKTTDAASTVANTKLNQIKVITNTNNIPEKDIQTANLSVYPEYSWSDNTNTLVWYRATQTITINVTDKDFATIGGKIVDEINKIGGVQINNVSFDINDKDAAMAQARTKAFTDAKKKAEQFAQAGWLTLQKPLSITDQSVNYYPPVYSMMAKESLGGGVGDTALSPGQMDVTVQVQVVFEVK